MDTDIMGIQKFEIKVASNSEAETYEFSQKVAKHVRIGQVIALIGNLGSGKTIFAKGFAAALDVKENISSPTFNIVCEYTWDDKKMLYHLDLYRINNSSDAFAFGINEYIYDKNAIILLEWPERIADILPEDTLFIKIEQAGKYKRTISLSSNIFENQ